MNPLNALWSFFPGPTWVSKMKASRPLADFSLSCFAMSLSVNSCNLVLEKGGKNKVPKVTTFSESEKTKSIPMHWLQAVSSQPTAGGQRQPWRSTYFLMESCNSSGSNSGTSFTSSSTAISSTSFCFFGGFSFLSSSSAALGPLPSGLFVGSSSFPVSVFSWAS